MQLGSNVNKFHNRSQHRHHEMCLVAKCNLHAKACHSCAVNTAWLGCEQSAEAEPVAEMRELVANEPKSASSQHAANAKLRKRTGMERQRHTCSKELGECTEVHKVKCNARWLNEPDTKYGPGTWPGHRGRSTRKTKATRQNSHE